jgi:transcription elongation factor Elf1
MAKKKTKSKKTTSCEVCLDDLIEQSEKLISQATEMADCLAAKLCEPTFVRKIRGDSISVQAYSNIVRSIRKRTNELKDETNRLKGQKLMKNVSSIYKKSLIESIERLNNNVKLANEGLLEQVSKL